MKTLDEVITAHEFCVNSSITGAVCEECPAFAKPDCEIREDALYYLKEYRDVGIKMNEEAKVQMQDILSDYVALKETWAEQQANPPLSFDELKQMEGKPVWIEYEHSNHRGSGKRWFLIKWFGNLMGEIMAVNVDGIYFDKEHLGVSWQAYRKERG